MPAKVAEYIPRDKLCVDIICPNKICRKVKKKDIIMIAVTMTNNVTGQFKITQYENNFTITTVNLVEAAWLTTYPWPMEITYYQGSEFIVHRFKIYHISKASEFTILSISNSLYSNPNDICPYFGYPH